MQVVPVIVSAEVRVLGCLQVLRKRVGYFWYKRVVAETEDFFDDHPIRQATRAPDLATACRWLGISLENMDRQMLGIVPFQPGDEEEELELENVWRETLYALQRIEAHRSARRRRGLPRARTWVRRSRVYFCDHGS
jgi:hypothetical protein